MTNDDYCRRLHDVKWTAGASARYHQIRTAKYSRADRCVRIGVAVAAVIALVLAVPPLEVHWWSFVAALSAAVGAVALNVIPVVEQEKFHGEMFRAWSELRKAAVLEEHKTCGGEPADHHVERLAELVGDMESLNAEEPFPDVKLQKKCEDDEDLSEYGRIQDREAASASVASAGAPERVS
jgi:hypothetical protein